MNLDKKINEGLDAICVALVPINFGIYLVSILTKNKEFISTSSKIRKCVTKKALLPYSYISNILQENIRELTSEWRTQKCT